MVGFIFIVIVILFILSITKKTGDGTTHSKETFIDEAVDLDTESKDSTIHSTVKGHQGEEIVTDILNRLGREKYSIYDDLYVPTQDGKSTQIDHIVTSPYGIFVIETKNYSGWIFGNEKSRYWTQVIYQRKDRFFNPVWQNAGHIKALKNYLHLEKSLFTSIIAFSRQSTLNIEGEFQQAKVTPFDDLIYEIKQNQMPVINDDQLKMVNKKLKQLVTTDENLKKQLKEQHIQSIKLDKEREKVAVANMNCPRCQGDLVKKPGKYGDFLGCSNFPYCRYTSKIK